MFVKQIDIYRIRELLDYNAETGVFRWKTDRSTKIRAGDIAGHFHAKQGYLNIMLDYKLYRAHRLAYCLVHGPIALDMDVDHIDGDRRNNRMSNLRLGTRSENKQNQIARRSDNKTGVTGVHRNKNSGKYQAYVSVNKKMRHIGLYDTLEEARGARLSAEKAHYPFSQINL